MRHDRACLLFACLAVGCAPFLPARRASGPRAGPDIFAERPADDLLRRSDLQDLIRRQERRDSASLITALGSPDVAVRARAAFALGSVQARSAVPALLRSLQDPAARVRADAAFAIGQSADSAAAPTLLDALDSERDPAVRSELLAALGKTGDLTSLHRLTSLTVSARERPVLALALARYGLRGIHAPDALARLVAGLRAGDRTTRLYSAYYFGRVTDTAAWRPHADEVRAALASLSATDPAAMYLVLGIGRLHDPADTPRLVSRLQRNGDWRIRANAARALGQRVDEPAARSALLTALDLSIRPGGVATHVAVAAAAALGVAPLTGQDLARVERWIAAHPEPWQVAGPMLRAVAAAGGTDVVLVWMRGHSQLAARADALAALGAAHDSTSLSVLLERSSDPAPRIAAAAIDALAARRDSAAYPRLVDALRRHDLAVRVAAAGALGDSIWLVRGVVAELRDTYASLRPPADIEVMQAIEAALRHLGAPAPDPPVGPSPRTAIDWTLLQWAGYHPRLVLETERGRVRIELDPQQAPMTTATVLRFALDGFYDGVPFHRVVPNFVVQGGDFQRADGYGGPGFAIPSEFTRIRYTRGTIGMASAGKDTEGSQYFVTHSVQPHLDGRYTAFGRVIEGMDVIDRILAGDRALKATVERH